jgi:hypothetical protein
MSWVTKKGAEFKSGNVIPKGSVIIYKSPLYPAPVLCLLVENIIVGEMCSSGFTTFILLTHVDNHINYKNLTNKAYERLSYKTITKEYFDVFMEEK